jgi:hypothetical protein
MSLIVGRQKRNAEAYGPLAPHTIVKICLGDVNTAGEHPALLQHIILHRHYLFNVVLLKGLYSLHLFNTKHKARRCTIVDYYYAKVARSSMASH